MDECERTVGQWQPDYKFTNIYSVIDHLQEQIEEFYYKSEELPATPNAKYTPSNSRHVDSISKRAQTFNTDLDKLQKKFLKMPDIDYEQAKINLVFNMAARSAAGQNGFIGMLLERLQLLQQMHQQAASIGPQLAKIRQGTVMLPGLLLREQAQVIKTNECLS